MKTKCYLAYGSNLNIAQMRVRCPQARVIGTGEIPDYQLLFKGSQSGAYLTIEPKEGSTVPVAVWEVTPEDEAALDRYEGWPRFYYKAEMNLPVKNARSGKVRTRRAFVYIMHEDRELAAPSRRYVQTCLIGYNAFGFDTAKLQEAYRMSTEVRE